MPEITEEQIIQLKENIPTSREEIELRAQECERIGKALKEKSNRKSRKLLRLLQKNTHEVMKALVRAYLNEVTAQRTSHY